MYCFFDDLVKGNSMEEVKSNLDKVDIKYLKDIVINTILNEFCDNISTKNDEDEILHEGKIIPYMGWFWRVVDFANKDITIGCECDEETNNVPYIAFMENNKWYYDERRLTEEEADKVIGLLLKARAKETRKETIIELENLYKYMQSLNIKEESK